VLITQLSRKWVKTKKEPLPTQRLFFGRSHNA
jgi:hypothetical protein